jgi:hypothetical protein
VKEVAQAVGESGRERAERERKERERQDKAASLTVKVEECVPAQYDPMAEYDEANPAYVFHFAFWNHL